MSANLDWAKNQPDGFPPPPRSTEPGLATLDPSEFLNPGSVHQSMSPMNTPSPETKNMREDVEQCKRNENEANQVKIEKVQPKFLLVYLPSLSVPDE